MPGGTVRLSAQAQAIADVETAAHAAYAAVPARYRVAKAKACECRGHVALVFSERD